MFYAVLTGSNLNSFCSFFFLISYTSVLYDVDENSDDSTELSDSTVPTSNNSSRHERISTGSSVTNINISHTLT